MRIGLQLRNSGPYADRHTLRECARIADASPAIDDLWVFDHIAIPPDQAEGSGGLYVDPLATLTFVAGVTERIGIGTRVLILPYRPALATAKWIASIQALSEGRLTLGVGVGWMEEEFRAVGVDRSRRGRITDETLDVFHRCFAADEVEVNGQRFLFKPRPERPPILVGGHPPQAFDRALRFGDGWAVPKGEADELRDPIARLREAFAAAEKPTPEVLAPIRAEADGVSALGDKIASLAEVGVTFVAIIVGYEDVATFGKIVEQASALDAG